MIIKNSQYIILIVLLKSARADMVVN